MVKAIADDYEDYVPNEGLPDNWDSVIEFKCDFDNAHATLNKMEQHLVFQPYCTESWKIGQRQKIFSKMVRFLNGES